MRFAYTKFAKYGNSANWCGIFEMQFKAKCGNERNDL